MGWRIEVHVKTNAPATEIVEKTDKYWRVSLHAKPIGGDANKELIKFLEKELNAKVEIIRGLHSKRKLVKISD